MSAMYSSYGALLIDDERLLKALENRFSGLCVRRCH